MVATGQYEYSPAIPASVRLLRDMFGPEEDDYELPPPPVVVKPRQERKIVDIYIDDFVCWDGCEPIDNASVPESIPRNVDFTYAQATKVNTTVAQGVARTTRMASIFDHVKPVRPLLCEEVRTLQARVKVPELIHTSPKHVEKNVSDELIDQEIMKLFANLSIGFNRNTCWTYSDGLIRKKDKTRCNKCSGFVEAGERVLDQPCICMLTLRHYACSTMIPEDKSLYAVLLSPGHRLSVEEWRFSDPLKKQRCGFGGELFVDAISKNDVWCAEMLGMFGPHLFSFTSGAFISAVLEMSLFARRVGGLHPDICESVGRMVCSLPNKRVVLSKLLSRRVSFSSCSVIRDIGVKIEFRHPFVFKKAVPFVDWRKTHDPWVETEAQGDELLDLFEIGQEVIPDTQPIHIPCTTNQSDQAMNNRYERLQLPYVCLVCSITCTSWDSLRIHENGARHRRALAWSRKEENFCPYCRVTCSGASAMREHRQGERHRKVMQFRYGNTEAQGILQDVVTVGSEITDTVRNMGQLMYDGLEGSVVFQRVWEVFGGEGDVPCHDRTFLCQLLPFLLRENSTSGWAHMEFVYLGASSWLSPPTKTAFKWISLVYTLWGFFARKSTVTETDSQGVAEVVSGVFKTLAPGFDLSETEKKEIGNNLRNHAMARQTVKDFWAFSKFVFEWVIGWFHEMLVETPASIKKWLLEVDGVDEVLLSDDGNATTLKVRMAKFHEQRRKIYQLLQTGKDMRRKLETIEKDKFTLKIVGDRIKKLESIISKNAGSFVGAEGKLKPHVIYFWGDPKAGKSALVDHFYSDLFHVLGEPDYNPAIDRYTINPITPYHDTYRYNRVVDLQDLMQVKAEETRQTELYDLIHMADESPFPLNVAECAGKGSIYFCSEHMVISSNFDLNSRVRDVTSLVECHSAITRRIDLYVKVTREDNGSIGYDRSQMRFEVDNRVYDWDQFLLLAAKSVLKVRERSMGVTNLVKDEQLITRLDALKTTLTEAQGFGEWDYKRELFRKIDEMEEACKMTTTDSILTWFGTTRLVSRFMPYRGWELSLIKLRARFAPLVAMFARFILRWGEIIAAGTALMVAWRSFAPHFATSSEGMPGRSGGESEFNVRRRYVRDAAKSRGPRQRAVFGEGHVTEGEGCLASNMAQVRQICVKNLGKFKGGRCVVHYFGMFDKVIAVPQHAFVDVRTDVCSLMVHGFLLNVDLSTLSEFDVLVMGDNHLVFINLASYLKIYPPFADIRRRLYRGGQVDYHQGAMFTSRGNFMDASTYVVNVDDIKMLDHKLRINMKTTTPFLLESGVEGVGFSEVGDCGAPWVLDHPTGALIMGLHVGGTPDKKMHATVLDRNLLECVVGVFKYSKESPVQIEPHGTEYDPPENVNTVEVLGVTTEVEWHIPRVTKIRKSIFHGIREPTTAPAQLKPFLIDVNGVLTKVSPLVLNFRKSFVTKISLEPQVLDEGARLLGEWYFPLPKDVNTSVLTIHEAIFGDPMEPYNKSINPQASIGWPWCERFTCRRELVSLQNRTIHPMLVAACDRLMAGSSEEFLFVDMLKDERLPLAKVADGKTRVFTVLPLHLNIVLKQLFGSFVMYMQSLRHVAPVKVGLAQTPDEWGKLWRYLNNGGQYVAGDYSAFDKVLHYEIIMMAVELANRFYADEHQELRRKLVDRVFTAFRYVDGVVYQTYGGMPSGCYLTASFNSLANALYWYCFLVDSGVDLEDHKDWFKVATFGDDHLVAIRDHPILNQVTFSKWLDVLGMKYTTASKGEVSDEYTPLEEITFLKRSFRHEGGYVWAPMPEGNLMEMIQWYRNTQTTKKLLPREIADDLLAGFELEAVHLGKTRYDALQQELLAKYPTKNKRTYEQARAVFLSPSYTSQFKTMNGNYTTFDECKEETSCEELLEISAAAGDCCDRVTTYAQGNEEDEPHVSETFLGETHETVLTKGLTKFVDQVVPADVTSSTSISPVIDGFFEISPGYFDMCKRWFKVGTQSLGTGDPSGYPLLRVDPLNFLIDEKHINTKLNSTTYLRYTLEIQIKLVSTKFHYGALMCVWRPYYAAGLLRMAYANRANPSLPNSGHWWLELGASEEKDGPYDAIYAASQSDHQILSVTARNTVTMTVPWNMPYQYVPVEQVVAPRYHPGFLDIYALTPIGPTNLDSPEILIFAAFKEIQGWGYKTYTNVNRIAECNYLKNADLANLSNASRWNVPVPSGPALNLNSPQSWKPIEITPPSVVYDTIAQGDPVAEQKAQSSGSWLLDTAYWILDTSRSVLTFLSPLGPILGFFGLSRPPDSTPVTRMIQSGVPMSNALGPDVSYSTAMNPLSLCVQDNKPEDKLITSVAGHLTYLGYLTFESGSLRKETMTFSPLSVKILEDRVYHTPGSFIISRFRYWRTNIKFHFRFYSSSFVSTRMALFVQYKWTGAEQGLCPTKIVDVAGDTQADVEIPFLYDTPWYDKFVPLSGTDLYNVSIQPLTDIVSDEAVSVSTKPVYCTVWISFPALQVSGMGGDVVDTGTVLCYPRTGKHIPAGDAPVVVDTLAQGDEDLPALGNGNKGDWGMNDIPASLYHLAKRYMPACATKIKPWNATLRRVTKDANSVYINDPPYYLYYAMLFRFFRTSVNVISNTKCVYDVIAPYGEHFRDGPTVTLWSLLSGFVYNPKNMCQARIPYRTNVSYIPTPIAMIFAPVTYADSPPAFTIGATDWSNADSAFLPKIGTGMAVSDPPAQLYVAAGDDLIYHNFIGVPVCVYLKIEALNTTFDATTDLSDTNVRIKGQPINTKVIPNFARM